MPTVAYVGAGANNAVAGNTIVVVAPAGVTDDLVAVVVLVWAVSATDEVPPTVTPFGSNWTTIVAPRTWNTMGYAVYSTTGRGAGDGMAFLLSANRLGMALDFYVSAAGAPVAGSLTERPVSANASTGASLSTTENSQLVLAVGVDRSSSPPNPVTASGATLVGYYEQTAANGGVWLGLVPPPSLPSATTPVLLTYGGGATKSGAAFQLAFPTITAPTRKQTRMAQIIDRLLVLSRALPNHRAPVGIVSTSGLVTVFDGPEVRSTDDAIDQTMVVVGWSGDDDESLEIAASLTLAGGPIAATNRPRDEQGIINCKAISHRADSVAIARDSVIAEVVAFAELCRADPSLGLSTSDTIGGVRTLAWVTAGSLVQYLSKGYVAEMDFTVSYSTRV
jgi:hypothetical protein